jgi:hypothetical protein
MDPAARTRLQALEIDGVTLIQADLPGVFRAIFTTRHCGRSQGLYASLNLDPRSLDDPVSTDANRSTVARLVGSLAGRPVLRRAVPNDGDAGTPEADMRFRLVSPRQEHGLRVTGAAEYVRDSSGEACDGLTIHPLRDRGLAATLMFADCVPVVLAGEVDAAIAHGGWRGILGGVVQQAARAMTGPPGVAVIGPSIGPCCFTVGEEVAQGFADRFGAQVVRRAAGLEPRVDLWAAVTVALAEVGVPASRVTNPRLCTCCNNDLFYSYRREGPVTGRHGAVLWAAALSPGKDGAR